MSRFAQVQAAPPVPIFLLSRAYQEDVHPNKIDLGIGAYRDNEGKPWVLPVVRKTQIAIASNPAVNNEYLPQLGLADFTKAAARLLLGEDSDVIKQKRVACCQSLSGTGAITLAANLLIKVLKYKTVYYSDPTWTNHIDLFKHAGCEDIRAYRYWDSNSRTLNIAGLLEDLEGAPENSIIILHACAHNPTGIDPSEENWKQIADVCEKKKLFPFFDCAYQGFASGNLENDIKSFRYFVSRGFETLCCQSFAKNFGLYNQRAGNLAIITKDPASVPVIESQLAILVRRIYSSPPAHGARIVSAILNDKDLFGEWMDTIKLMSSRILQVRKALRQHLEDLKTPGSWSHITDQIGMFSYTGLSEAQVKFLVEQYHIYLPKDGRISLAGLNTGNVQYVAEAIKKAVETV